MKIGTLNINGFVDSSTKRSLILKLIGEQNFDIICLQETHFNNSENLNDFLIFFKGQYFVKKGTEIRGGDFI